MRGIESLMLAALFGLIALGVWQGRKWLPDFTLHRQPAVVAALKPSSAKDQKRNSKSVHGGRSKASGISGNFNETPNNSTVVDVPVAPAPNPETLVLGTTRSALQEQYGTPALDVTARREGKLIERYYYFTKDAGHLTVATLRDGKVISTEAIPY